MKRTLSLIALLLASAAGAQPNPPATPQPAIEKVIVSAPRFNFAVTPNAKAHVFIQSFATPTMLLGKIARWQAPICPETRGLAPAVSAFVDQRIRTIAKQAGAAVAAEGCKSNLSITFTTQPQTLLDNIRAKDAEALGYHGATMITHPIQAWYVTGTEDLTGRVFKDVETIYHDDTINPFMNPPRFFVNSPTPMTKVEGMPGRNGLKSRLVSAFIIVDAKGTGKLEIPAMADYVAMLALSRTESYESCQIVHSITNLAAPDCGEAPDGITASDMAYLKGLYAMDAGANLQVQQDEIAGEMAKALAGGK